MTRGLDSSCIDHNGNYQEWEARFVGLKMSKQEAGSIKRDLVKWAKQNGLSLDDRKQDGKKAK